MNHGDPKSARQSANERKRTQNRWNWHGVMLFLRGFDRAYVQDFLVSGVCKALICEGQHADNQQNDASGSLLPPFG